MTPPNHNTQLAQFGESQLSELSSRDICASTVHLILATAFFTGAAISLAKPLKAPKKTYLASLHRFLTTHFGLSAENAKGMVESNARLYKRYVLIEKIYTVGANAAVDWYQNSTTRAPALKDLLKQYHTLSMSGLNIEGIKEAKQPAAVEIETITQVEAVPAAATREPRWGRRLFWLLFITLLGLLVYAALFPENIPTQLLKMFPTELHHLLYSPSKPLP